MVYKLVRRPTFDARKQMALVVPSFKYTLGCVNSGLRNAKRERFRLVDRSGVLQFRTEDSGELHTNYIPGLPKLESEIINRLRYVMAIV